VLRLTGLELVGCPSSRTLRLCYDLLAAGLNMLTMLTVSLHSKLEATRKYHLVEALSHLREGYQLRDKLLGESNVSRPGVCGLFVTV
jgi:hypothetical protein